MANNTTNVHAYGDVTNAVWTAPLGATAPSAIPAAMPANWVDLGWLSDQGVTESRSNQETKKYAWQGAVLIRSLRSQFENPFKFQAIEESLPVIQLQRPGKAITTTPGTSEVQTITLTGTGTAGTFSVTLPAGGPILGTATGLAYNITTSALATALNSAFGATGITVSGTPGTTYSVTFPAVYGDLPTMTSVNSITGVSAITHATTTPGVATTYSQGQGGISSNRRQFAIDLHDGTFSRRIYIPQGEAAVTGDIVFKSDDITVYEFTVTPYADASGNFYYDLTNNPVYAGTFV